MSILAHLSRLKLTETTLSDTLRPKQLSEGSFTLSSNCYEYPLTAKQRPPTSGEKNDHDQHHQRHSRSDPLHGGRQHGSCSVPGLGESQKPRTRHHCRHGLRHHHQTRHFCATL